MKVTIKNNALLNQEIKLPLLMQYIDHPDLIVLFTARDEKTGLFLGTVIHTQTTSSYTIGNHSDSWSIASFKPFIGTITLEQ